MPNTHDKLVQRLAHGTLSANPVTPQTNPNITQGLKSGLFQLVMTNSVEVSDPGTGTGISTAIFVHNLGYTPLVLAAMNNTAVASEFGTVNNASLPLPIFTDATIGGGQVTFNTWLYHYADNTNVYVNILNGTGAPRSAIISLYIFRTGAVVPASS